jgi:uncharacterized membrane protein YhaH (DUF805 family)
MLGYLDFLFLSYSGRIGRLTYWVSSFVLGFIELGAMIALLTLSGASLAGLHADDATMVREAMLHLVLPLGIVTVIFLYPAYAITTKRWHDRGKSGWWSLIGFVPIIGGLWLLIELGFLGPSEYVNQYGTR